MATQGDDNMQDSEHLTYFAPAERYGDDEIRAQHLAFCKEKVAVGILEAMPDPTLVVNDKRQIVASNTLLLDSVGILDVADILGLRPGELMGCIHSDEMPGGCGTAHACRVCGAVKAILGCFADSIDRSEECRLSTNNEQEGGSLDVLVHAKWISLPSGPHAVLDLRDISAEKRRRVLERVFFHDVVNTASGIRAIAELMKDYPQAIEKERSKYERDLYSMADQMIEEIVVQRQLLAAEQSELQTSITDVRVSEIAEDVVRWYSHHSVAKDKSIIIEKAPDCTIRTDRMLLRRCLGNVIKNALEATSAGGEVNVSACVSADTAMFTITNPGVMPDHVQQQIFNRSFSTKGGPGRGIGTYSVKLFMERYLKGSVSFTSQEPQGTSFVLTVPCDLSMS